MNQIAYDSKFQTNSFISKEVWKQDKINVKQTEMKKPVYELIVIADIRCTPELAPLALR